LFWPQRQKKRNERKADDDNYVTEVFSQIQGILKKNVVSSFWAYVGKLDFINCVSNSLFTLAYST
jgi:hypothetical protein